MSTQCQFINLDNSKPDSVSNKTDTACQTDFSSVPCSVAPGSMSDSVVNNNNTSDVGTSPLSEWTPPSDGAVYSANTTDGETVNPAKTDITAECSDTGSSTVLTELTLEYQGDPVVCNIDAEGNAAAELSKLQWECPELKDILAYLVRNELPEDDKKARSVMLEGQNHYAVIDNVLYHLYTPRVKNVNQVGKDRLIKQVALPLSKRSDILLRSGNF